MTQETAMPIALKVIKMFEGCNLKAYPDPSSDLYKELSKHNLLHDYMQGKVELPDYLREINGKPFTCGWGDTLGVTIDTVWTQAYADSKLVERVQGFMQAVLKVSPNLANESPERLAACTSLAYNVGNANYASSTVAKCVAKEDHVGAANAFSMWNKAKGVVVQGLVNRRKIESDLYRSAKG